MRTTACSRRCAVNTSIWWRKRPCQRFCNTYGLAIELGVGTGVLSALLVRRGVARMLATDVSDRALICASENLTRLGVASQVTLLKTDAYPS
jgi:methylase of polypeptide subunit release factors